MGADQELLRAWLVGRSVARRLAAPIPDYGGFRVDTDSDSEKARWIFPHLGDGLRELARKIDSPRYLLKLCGTEKEFYSALPELWRVRPSSYFMSSHGWTANLPLPLGFQLETQRDGRVAAALIRNSNGEVVSSGYAAETDKAFVYDRIVTVPGFRRKGLATGVMAALRSAKHDRELQELLVATEDGHELYKKLGWMTISPYSTAAIDPAAV